MFTRERLTRWTKALRANPEQQLKGHLANRELTKFCCLGKLAYIEGVNTIIDPDNPESCMFNFEGTPNRFVLTGQLACELGDSSGRFYIMQMPDLKYKDVVHDSAAEANDSGVPWPVIADHFDKYYPCSDEQH